MNAQTEGLIKLNHDDILDDAHMSEGIVSYLTFSGIHDFQRYHGGLRRFAPNDTLTFNSGFKTGWSCTAAQLPEDPTNRFWTGQFQKLGGEPPLSQNRRVYSKVIHLVDPFEFMTRSHILSYLPGPDANDRDQLRKHAISRYNQASVDATICYMLSRLGNAGLSPATVEYYETICGIADNYMYRITDDFMTLRNKLWFWSFADNGTLLKVEGSEVSEELRSWILNKPAEASLDSSFYEEISLDDSSALPSPVDATTESLSFNMEELDIGSATLETEGDAEPIKMSPKNVTDEAETASLTETEAHIEELEDCGGEIYLRCKNIPVLVCFQQAAEGTMDQLLGEIMDTESQDSDACGIFGLPECERMWSAWLFQICAALSVFQRYVNFCHNDLHTNNIVWVSTEEQYLYYKSQDGVYYKVPTYGKIFKLIDFGRATAEIGNIQLISTDYAKDQDAWGQYNWGPIKDESEPEIAPNPSFDLSRLAVSIFETLYPAYDHVTDADESPLAALIWSWLQDDEGKSILYDDDDIERFPGFDLYIHIAHHVHGAIPNQQFNHRAFNQFKWRGKAARTAQVKWWPLFSCNTNID